MLPFRQLLFPVDFSDSCRAMVPSVLRMAQFYNCPITLLYAFQIPISFYTDMGPMDFIRPTDIQGNYESQLRKFAAEYFPTSKPSLIVEQGEASAVIHNYVKHQGTDLIMMPTRGCGPLRRMLMGSVVSKVLHDVSLPVWTTAHNVQDPIDPHWPIRNILCCLSLEEESTSLAQAAGILANSFNARLTLFHACGQAQAAIDTDYEHYRRQLLESATQKLQSLRWELKLEAALLLVEGSAIMNLREQALAIHADLVIVGRGHAQEALGRLWSDLYDVIRESPCPVLSI